jgi:hypothetical protein
MTMGFHPVLVDGGLQLSLFRKDAMPGQNRGIGLWNPQRAANGFAFDRER